MRTLSFDIAIRVLAYRTFFIIERYCNCRPYLTAFCLMQLRVILSKYGFKLWRTNNGWQLFGIGDAQIVY